MDISSPLVRQLHDALGESQCREDSLRSVCATLYMFLQLASFRLGQKDDTHHVCFFIEEEIIASYPDLSDVDVAKVNPRLNFEIDKLRVTCHSKWNWEKKLKRQVIRALKVVSSEIEYLVRHSPEPRKRLIPNKKVERLEKKEISDIELFLEDQERSHHLKHSLRGLFSHEPPSKKWDVKASWVWTSCNRFGEMAGIFLLVTDSDFEALSNPWLVNPSGKRGLVHESFENETPLYIPDFRESGKWDIDQQSKNKFFNYVDQGKKRDSLIYYPITDRLALQLVFSVEGGFPEHGLGWALAIKKNADYVVQSAFFDALTDVVEYDLFYGENIGAASFKSIRVGEQIKTLVEAYPIPRLKVDYSKTGEIRFSAPSGEHCKREVNFSNLANAKLQAIIRSAKAKSAENAYIKLGSAALGVVHTVNRESDFTLNVLEDIQKFGFEGSLKQFNESQAITRKNLVSEVVKLHRYVDLKKKIADLDILALEELRGKNSSRAIENDGPIQLLTRLDLIEEDDSSIGRDKSVRVFKESKWDTRFLISDKRSAELQKERSATVSLIVLELILNASKYLDEYKEHLPSLAIGTLPARVELDESKIKVANLLVSGDEDNVISAVGKGLKRKGKSLNKIGLWAGTINNNIEFSLEANHLVFTIFKQ